MRDIWCIRFCLYVLNVPSRRLCGRGLCDRRKAHKHLAHVHSVKDHHSGKDTRDTHEIFEKSSHNNRPLNTPTRLRHSRSQNRKHFVVMEFCKREAFSAPLLSPPPNRNIWSAFGETA